MPGPPRPVADLYECKKCGQWLPAVKFQRPNNKSGLVFTDYCRVCSGVKRGNDARAYIERLKNDPVALLAAIANFESKRPVFVEADKDKLKKYYKWLMGFNAFKAKMGLIPKKPPFDIVTYVMRKVKYGRISQEEAEARIESYYQRHPESRPSGS